MHHTVREATKEKRRSLALEEKEEEEEGKRERERTSLLIDDPCDPLLMCLDALSWGLLDIIQCGSSFLTFSALESTSISILVEVDTIRQSLEEGSED